MKKSKMHESKGSQGKITHISAYVLIIILMFSGIITVIGISYASSVSNISLEIKDPLEILEYPTSLSLFPGETTTFNLKIRNHVTTNYSVQVDCQLNDTNYQTKYVTTSNEIHSIYNGYQTIESWLKVSPNAPEKIVMMTINLTRVSDNTGTQTVSGLPASLELLAGGTKWAANNGNTALYVNWKDNWIAHSNTDGSSWGPWPVESKMDAYRFSVAQSLEHAGFNIEFAADIPETLTKYDVVIINPYWAVEPQHSTLIKDYVTNGGGVIILGGTPCYFSVFCKDCWPYRSYGAEFDGLRFGLSPIQEWFGARYYINVGGNSHLTINNPFGTSLSIGDKVMFVESGSSASVTTLSSNTQIVSQWDSGQVFAFTHQYRQGRVYYQAAFETIDENTVLVENEKNELVVNSSPIVDVVFQINGELQTTPYRADFSEGNYIIEMPQTQNEYVWSHWLETGDTNRVKVVNMNQKTTLTAVYSPNNESMTVSVVSPQNTTYTTNQIPLQFITNQDFNKAAYSLDNKQNTTIFGNTSLTELEHGTHNIKVFVEDKQENVTESETVYFTIDTPSVGFEILSPENTTYAVSEIPLNYLVNETCTSLVYSLDSQATIDAESITKLSGLTEGVHELTLIANFTDNNSESVKVCFTVDTTPPEIAEVTELPVNNEETIEESIKINATVSDSGSGVNQVTLNYTTDNQTWTSIEMINIENKTWNTELPAFPLGTNISYIITAQDKVGNKITTEEIFGQPNQYQILTDVVLWVVLPTSLVVMASAVISKKQIAVPKLTKLNNKIHKMLSD